MHLRPEGTTLGRLTDAPDPGYTKSNCRWQTPQEQWAERKARAAMTLFEAKYGHRAVKVA
jgi:hypothetical protein